MYRGIAVLGSTGSIGTQTLLVCKNLGLRVEALAAGGNIELLARQAREFLPRFVAVADKSRYKELKEALSGLDVEIGAGEDAICEAGAGFGADIVMNAVVGVAGLRPTLAAIEAGKNIALANKEALVTGGELVMAAVKRAGTAILPVDSEHSAIFQCLAAGKREDVRGVVLTASGGPFAGKTREELAAVEIRHALAHPNWSMGAKITVDSATLMNKGLEFIEAMWLFGLAPDQIEVVVHRQSVIHSAVEFVDGSVIAQLAEPDMRSAIQYALTNPARYGTGGERMSLTRYGTLTFEPPDYENFPCLGICIDAARRGGLVPTVANGANEQAVALFLAGKIRFLDIGELVGGATASVSPEREVSLEAIREADRAAREYVLANA